MLRLVTGLTNFHMCDALSQACISPVFAVFLLIVFVIHDLMSIVCIVFDTHIFKWLYLK